MSSGHTIAITPTDERVEVRLGDLVLADSDRTLRLDETGLPARYYVPQDDVRMELLQPTTFHTTCPFKGVASYWSVTVDGATHDGIAWAYEAPIEKAAAIAGYLSFYPDRVTVSVDGRTLAA